MPKKQIACDFARACSSGAESGRELFKGSKDSANLLVCNSKKIIKKNYQKKTTKKFV